MIELTSATFNTVKSSYEVEETTVVLEEKEITKPRQYQVVLLNDDFTTFDFVVYILIRYFNKSQGEAEQITHHIHTQKRGIAGIFSKDEAESKARMVIQCARENQFPLLCEAEPI